MFNNKEKIKAIEEYIKYFPRDYIANDNLLLCTYADELGIDLDNTKTNYRIDNGYFMVNAQTKYGKKYYLTNSETKYKCKESDNNRFVIWDAVCGRLEFVDNRYYDCITDEWEGLLDVLLSYQPLDYDYINSVYVYDLEHGKKLINDYDDIIEEFMNKVNVKIKEYNMFEKRQRLERLQKELEEMES